MMSFTIWRVYVKVIACLGNEPTFSKTLKTFIKGEQNEDGACGIECFRSCRHGRMV